MMAYRRKFKVKLLTIWTDGKAKVGRVREEKRRSGKRKSQKKEDAGARKRRKVAKHCVFPMICGSGGSKSRLAKVLNRFAWQAQRILHLAKSEQNVSVL